MQALRARWRQEDQGFVSTSFFYHTIARPISARRIANLALCSRVGCFVVLQEPPSLSKRVVFDDLACLGGFLFSLGLEGAGVVERGYVFVLCAMDVVFSLLRVWSERERRREREREEPALRRSLLNFTSRRSLELVVVYLSRMRTTRDSRSDLLQGSVTKS